MSLEDLNQKLHGRDAHLDRTRLVPKDVHTSGEISAEQAAFQQRDVWQSNLPLGTAEKNDIYIVNAQTVKRKKWLWWGVGGFVTLLVVGALGFLGYTFWERQSAVTVSIEGPQNVASAEPVSFRVAYQNDSWTSVSDMTLTLTLPETFQPEVTPGLVVTGRKAEVKLGDLEKNGTGQYELKGKFYGSKGQKGNIDATLRYMPQATSSHFETKTTLGVTLATSPLLFEIEGPLELVNGQELDYVVTYENRSNETLNNLRIALTYPTGFQFLSADQKTESGNNNWYLSSLAPNQKGKIVVHGLLSGSRDEFKRLQGKVGILQGDGTIQVYSETERATKMIASPLSLSQTVNGQTDVTIFPGDLLAYSLKYRNDAAIGMRDVVITQSIDTTYLDVAKLTLDSGAYDPTSKQIIWRAADVKELAQLARGQEGELTFTIPVLSSFTLSPETGKSIVIRSLATIDSPDVPAITLGNKIIGSNTLLLKLGALAGFQVTPFYTDKFEPNSGPLPPVVGQETTYTVRLRIDNSSNDLAQSRAVVAFPSGVRYKGKSFPRDATLSLNERTNELTWEIGTVSPSTPRELVFQVAVTPNESQIGKAVELVKRATFTAKDTFTNREVRSEKTGVTNQLGEAESGTEKSGVVRAKE